MSEKIFGIDLGTTYSCISYVDEHGKPVVIKNSDNDLITPSVVFFEDENIIVGKVAKESFPSTQVVSFIKSSMGDANFFFEYQGLKYKPEEISAYILKKLVCDATQNLGLDKVTNVVITCPAYFGINEREATKRAGEIAGLNVRAIINEPTAAAIAYGLSEESGKKVILVYDLGGGTFDVTMIDISPESIQVICTGGDHNLGGKNWDDRIVTYLAQQFNEQTGTNEDILEDSETFQALLITAENAKKILSQKAKAPISITHGGQRARLDLTKEKFEELTQDLMERTIFLTNDMLQEAKKKNYNSFDEILLVGGSTKMPMVKKRVEQEYSKPIKMFDPDESVSKGASLYGQKLSINDKLIQRISEIQGVAPEKIDLDKVSKTDLDKATKHVADESGFTLKAVEKAQKTKITNVSSKSFGVVANSPEGRSVVYNLVIKNEKVPVEITQEFGTQEYNQENVEVIIKESELSDKKIEIDQTNEIGKAILKLPPNLPEKSPIPITFNLNDEGRLYVTAIEITTHETVNIIIETASVIQGKELEEAKTRTNGLVFGVSLS